MKFAGPVFILTTFLALGHAQTALAAEGKADDADPVTKVQKMNRYAMQLFDDVNFALAEKTLLDALAIVEKANLASGPAGLATHGNLAVLYSIGLKNPDKAVFHFKKALAIKPDLKLSKQRATPETEANLARAKAEIGGVAPPPASRPKEGGPAVEAKHVETASDAVVSIKCPTGGEVKAGDEITLKCLTAADLHPAAVMLYYKPNGGDDYQVLSMTKSGMSGAATAWVGKIPASHTKGKWIPVYFEARDEHGISVALSGREDSPSVISVKGGEAASTSPTASAGGEVDNGEGEDEEEEDDEGEEIDDNNPLARLENERRREHQGSKGTWWLGFGLGSGVGYASGNSTETFPDNKVGFSPGMALAFLGHAVPEIGYFVGRNTALAITGRDQLILGGWKGTPWGANAVLLRLLFFTDGDEKIRWYFATAAGWGDAFRLQVEAQSQVLDKNGNVTTVIPFNDTVKGGPWTVGIGGGMLYKLNRRWRWTVDTQALLGFTHYSAVLDLTTGLRWMFQ
jgi:hypothetical protein